MALLKDQRIGSQMSFVKILRDISNPILVLIKAVFNLKAVWDAQIIAYICLLMGVYRK